MKQGLVKLARVPKVSVARMTVSETNLKKAAIRLLGQKLVSPEVQYIQRTLGGSATQQQLDASGLEVRRRLWFRAKGAPRDLKVYAVQRSPR